MTSVSGQAADVSVMSMSATVPDSPCSRSSPPAARVDDVDAEFGIDDVVVGLLDVGEQFVVRGLTHLRSPFALPRCVIDGAGLCQRGLECHPAEQRALHPGRILRHPGERDAVTDQILVTLDGALTRSSR